MGKLRAILILRILLLFGGEANVQAQLVFGAGSAPGFSIPNSATFAYSGASYPLVAHSQNFGITLHSGTGTQNVTITGTVTNVVTSFREIISARLQGRSNAGVWTNLTAAITTPTPVTATVPVIGGSAARYNYRIEFTRAGNIAFPPSPRKLADFGVGVSFVYQGTAMSASGTPLVPGRKYNSGGPLGPVNLGQGPPQQQGGSTQQGIPQQQRTPQQQWGQMQQHGRISGRGTTMILKRRFNPKSGKVELIKNGVISRLGYLNLKGKNLNRRQALRNYRYR